jgi:hypothetical protein
MNVVPLEPRTLTRSRQPDRQNHRSLAGTRGSRRSLARRLSRDHWFRDGCLRCGRFHCGSFCADCGCRRSRSLPRTTSATTSAAATTARRSWSWFTRRRRRGCCRDRFRCGRRLRLRSRRAARLDDRSRHWSCGRRVRLIIVEPRLQGLGRVGCFFGGALSGLLAALQALGHPFAHIAACSIPAHDGAIRDPWR